jgi:hypothetical protein
MKRSFLSFVAVLTVFSAASVLAQSDMIILQKAKNLRDANNAQQGVPPSSAPATPPPPPPADSTPSPVQQEIKRNLDKVALDLAAIKSGTAVPGDQKQSLQNDLLALSCGSVKPSKDALSKLAEDLSSALSGNSPASGEHGRLAAALSVILNSSMTTPVQAQKSVQTAQDVLKSSGVPDAAVQAVANDCKAILADVQKKTPKLYQ